jgi:hypothetical protein
MQNVQYLCPVLSTFLISVMYLLKLPNIKVTKMYPLGAELFHADGWRRNECAYVCTRAHTHTQTAKLASGFLQFLETCLKKVMVCLG